MLPQPPQVFTARNCEALFPWPGTLGCVVLLTPLLFPLVCLHTNVELPIPPACCTTCPILQPLPCCAFSPTSPNERFFFNPLVVGLPYSSIIWQFWLCFHFKFFVVLPLVEQGSKVYLHTPPSWLEDLTFSILIMMCLGVGFFVSISFGTLCNS